MKRFVGLIVLFMLLFQSMAHFSVVAVFALRQDYIARNLCENRNRPALNCCGKCVLQKQLDKVDQQNDDSRNTPAKVVKQEAPFYILPGTIPNIITYHHIAESRYNPGTQRMHNYNPVKSIFHPPSRWLL